MSFPKMTDITPDRSVVNRSNIPVTIEGKGFNASSVITIGGTGVTYSDPVVVSDKKITAKFHVGAGLQQGERDVFVTVNGVPTNSKKFKAQVPYQLRVVADTGSRAFIGCTYTYGREITYKFVDSNGDEIKEAVHFKEAFDNQSPTNSCGNGLPQPYPQSFLRTFKDSIAIVADCSDATTLSVCRRNGSCGYQHIQKWLTWGDDSNLALFSLPGITHCNEIKINGVLQYEPGDLMPRQP